MTHWKQLVPNLNYIGAYALDGKDLTVKILSVKQEIVKGTGGTEELCIVAQLQGQRPMILNRTNSKMITKLLGTPEVEKWAGKSITLYPTTTKAGGEVVECLRIRPTLPKDRPKVDLAPGHAKWDDAVAYIAKGGTVEKLLETYNITPENQAILNTPAK